MARARAVPPNPGQRFSREKHLDGPTREEFRQVVIEAGVAVSGVPQQEHAGPAPLTLAFINRPTWVGGLLYHYILFGNRPLALHKDYHLLAAFFD